MRTNKHKYNPNTIININKKINIKTTIITNVNTLFIINMTINMIILSYYYCHEHNTTLT